VNPDMADQLATEMMRNPELALEAHAREELGIDPAQLGSPVGAAASSFVAFALGAFVPLLPWLVSRGAAAAVASVILGVLGAVGIGAALGAATGKTPLRPALRHLAVAGAAAVVGYVLGMLIGGTTPT